MTFVNVVIQPTTVKLPNLAFRKNDTLFFGKVITFQRLSPKPKNVLDDGILIDIWPFFPMLKNCQAKICKPSRHVKLGILCKQTEKMPRNKKYN